MELLLCFKVLFFLYFKDRYHPVKANGKFFFLTGGGCCCCCLLNIQTTPFIVKATRCSNERGRDLRWAGPCRAEKRGNTRGTPAAAAASWFITSPEPTAELVSPSSNMKSFTSESPRKITSKRVRRTPSRPGTHLELIELMLRTVLKIDLSHFPTSRSPNLRWRSAGGRGSTTAWRP